MSQKEYILVSDCFDHWFEAEESRWFEEWAPAQQPQSLFKLIHFSKLLNSTDKCFQLEIEGEAVWVPIKIIREFNPKKKTAYVHCEIYDQITGNSIGDDFL